MPSFIQICRVAAGLALALAVQARAAEPARPVADPADPNAAVPATRYQFALPYRPAKQPARTADQEWKARNHAVGAINSMSLTMGSAAEPATPPASDAQPAGASAPEQHHHHETKQ
jgi:hypothetical protein